MNRILMFLYRAACKLLVPYTLSKCRPLKGVRKGIFVFTAIILCTVLFSLTIVFFPHFKGGFSSDLCAFIAIALSVLALWLWYQILLFSQPKSQTELSCKPQVDSWQLRPDNIVLQNADTIYGEALIFRPKESNPVSEYYFILIDGAIVAALEPGEFTKVKLQHKVNEIGCYAKSSNETFNTNYKLNVESFEVNQNEPLALTVTSDMFVGSCISKISSKEVQKYQTICNYVEQGPRHNTRLDQPAINPPPVSL